MEKFGIEGWLVSPYVGSGSPMEALVLTRVSQKPQQDAKELRGQTGEMRKIHTYGSRITWEFEGVLSLDDGKDDELATQGITGWDIVYTSQADGTTKTPIRPYSQSPGAQILHDPGSCVITHSNEDYATVSVTFTTDRYGRCLHDGGI